jgi:hypothetical protein
MGVTALSEVREGGDEEGCPKCKHTKRTGHITSGNGGWTRDGMNLCNKLHKRAKEDRQNDDGAFGKVQHREHRGVCAGRKERGGMQMGLVSSSWQHADDLEQLWTAAAARTAGI